MGTRMAFAIGMGTAVGVAVGQLALGIAIGVTLAALTGLFGKRGCRPARA